MDSPHPGPQKVTIFFSSRNSTHLENDRSSFRCHWCTRQRRGYGITVSKVYKICVTCLSASMDRRLANGNTWEEAWDHENLPPRAPTTRLKRKPKMLFRGDSGEYKVAVETEAYVPPHQERDVAGTGSLSELERNARLVRWLYEDGDEDDGRSGEARLGLTA
ncbi:Hypothetical predicted protein [Lecanosticta acicola]|uniref:Uncharacterized protein n=1 Tax=Lecanosticta acicola TaxID=111012 RepID=A0AAI8YYH2_9PEZI|nr:Hypothetical predicted protein [Lecanosticta acicola]